MKKYILILLLMISSIFLLQKLVGNKDNWQYQCIDTMKTSRDMARSPLSKDAIDAQMQEIKNLGANCVAIDTPYDNEFLPYMTLWVTEARKYDLHIWFRGNFSSWEGWFNYPTNMTTQDELTQTSLFITKNPQLFQNGDIFTPAPEAENGGPFVSKTSDTFTDYRQFLLDENTTSKTAFKTIHKNVITNWLSMSGGWAKAVLNQETIDKLGKVVVIDHYVTSPKEMTSYIEYFSKKYKSNVVIGEFGAPIPNLNGNMDSQQQSQFVNQVFKAIKNEGNIVIGVNYWVLTNGSTALLDSNNNPKPVTSVIANYFK